MVKLRVLCWRRGYLLVPCAKKEIVMLTLRSYIMTRIPHKLFYRNSGLWIQFFAAGWFSIPFTLETRHLVSTRQKCNQLISMKKKPLKKIPPCTGRSEILDIKGNSAGMKKSPLVRGGSATRGGVHGNQLIVREPKKTPKNRKVTPRAVWQQMMSLVFPPQVQSEV